MTISDRILGVVGGAMVMAALVLLVLGGTRDRGAAATGVAPGIEIVSPTDGAVLEGPLEVVFRVPAERKMAMGAGGWGMGDHHIHLELDSVELMPAATDIQRVARGEYRWTVGPLEAGSHAFRLLWSGPDHRRIPETATPPVRVVR